MTEAELTAQVDAIRERRNKAVITYQQAQEASKQARDEKVKLQIDKQLAMFAKKLATVEKGLTELENRAVKIMALRLELGDDIRK